MNFTEMLFLGLLGLVVFGPKKLSRAGAQLGRALAQFRAYGEDLKSQIPTDSNLEEGTISGSRPVPNTLVHLAKRREVN